MLYCDYKDGRISITSNLRNIVDLVLSGEKAEFKATYLVLNIKHSSEDLRIYEMNGTDNYSTSYSFKAILE